MVSVCFGVPCTDGHLSVGVGTSDSIRLPVDESIQRTEGICSQVDPRKQKIQTKSKKNKLAVCLLWCLWFSLQVHYIVSSRSNKDLLAETVQSVHLSSEYFH